LSLIPSALLSLVMACDGRGQRPAADALAEIQSDTAPAEAMYWRGEYDSARSLWSVDLVRARSSNDRPTEARLLTWQGLAAWRLGDYSSARRLGEAALALKLHLGLTPELFRSYNALGLLAWNEGRLLDATELLKAASASALAVDDRDGLAKAAGNLALVQTELAEFALARVGFTTMLQAARTLSDRRVEGNALTNLGMLDIRIGDPGSAIPRLLEARRLYHSIGYGPGQVSAMGQLGVAYQVTGELQLALAAIDSALRLSRTLHLRQEEASNLETLANLHQEAGDWRRALRLYAEAQTLNGELGLSVEQATDLRLEAEIQLELGETDLARRKATEALALHGTAQARVEELQDHIILADLAQMDGKAVSAREHLRLAGRLAANTGARAPKAQVALATARISLLAGDYQASLRSLARARSNLAYGDFALESQAQGGRAAAFRGLGQLDSAALAGYAGIEALERVRGSLGSGTLRTTFLASKTAAYSQLVDILIEQDNLESAFEVADAVRGRALLEHLASARAAPEGTPTVRTLTAADELLRRSGALAAELANLDDTPPGERDSSYDAMHGYFVAQLEQSRNSFEVLLLHLAARDAPAVQLLNAGRTYYPSVRASLRSDEALLEYLVGPEQVHLFLVTPSGIRRYSIAAKAEDLSARTRLARELAARPGSPTDSPPPVLSALYDLLIRPALAAGGLSGVRRLLIVPHGALVYLPFAALHNRESGRYLAEDFALMALPAAGALPSLRSGRATQVTMPGYGSTVFAPYPEALPATRTESAAFLRAVPGAQAQIGGKATERALRKALERSGLVHLATHGRMNSSNPMFSRLDLSPGQRGDLGDDGRLEVHEVLGLKIRSPLVFLSGCETGIGAAWSNRYQQGEDYATLSQAFLYAGAGSVVATLWPIADDGAAAFAERFYHYLYREAAPEALASAQRDLLRTGTYRAPYYWAAYQVAGGRESIEVAQK
jgi:CHAT domain-containing protein/tetratricopeptide (TPR) repeat protein